MPVSRHRGDFPIPTALSQALPSGVGRSLSRGRKRGLYHRLRGLPFISMHVALLTVFLVPVTWTALGLCVALHFIRMFGITGGYHRYFSHRSYKTGRVFQFVLAWLGCSAVQKGPLWWASHHRHHHKHSDQEDDPHSPIIKTVWWSHVGWVISGRYRGYDRTQIRDFQQYPELRFLTKFHWFPGIVLAGLCYAIDGWSGVVWGFVVSTVLLYHTTFLVNSACHLFGTRRYETTDQSRNNWWVALLTMGEGWHNNHHHYQSCARQGFRWWEVDMTYYILRALAVFGVVWDIREPTEKALATKRLGAAEPQVEEPARAESPMAG